MSTGQSSSDDSVDPAPGGQLAVEDGAWLLELLAGSCVSSRDLVKSTFFFSAVTFKQVFMRLFYRDVRIHFLWDVVQRQGTCLACVPLVLFSSLRKK